MHSSYKPFPPGPVASTRPYNDSNVTNGHRPFRSTSTNPFDFPPSPSSSSPPPPPVPPRPHAQQAHSPAPPPLPPYPLHANSNSDRSRRYHVPQLTPFPADHVPHRQSHSAQSHRYEVPKMTAFPTNYDSDPNRPSSSSVSTPPWAESPNYLNNPWDDPSERERDLGWGLEGWSRNRAKSTVEQRPSPRPHTVSTFVAPTMAFPVPELPGMPSLGRATSAKATVPVNAKTSATNNIGHNDHSDSNSNHNTGRTTPTTPITPTGSRGPLNGYIDYPDSSGPSTGRTTPTNHCRPSSGRGNGVRGEFRFNPSLIRLQHMPSVSSLASATSTYSREEDGFASPTVEFMQLEADGFAKELSNLSQNMDENILRFQKGELPEADQEWHRLVPEEALKALDDAELKRQGLIFELLKAEREYVADLETMEAVFIKGILEASPPIIPEANMSSFLNNVFGNLHEILVHHQKMLEALFERQRDSHPLIQSVADIILETVLRPEFRNAYEKYIENYPVSESIHQKELKGNRAYANFLQSVSGEPRIKKRDFKIFLSRPVTRLIRLNMLVEQMHKRTNKDHGHPDVDTLPIILNIVSDCIKATQPGIETAEQRVKFWDLCENLISQKGEITDMDLYDKERHLVNTGAVWRRIRADGTFSSDKWMEIHAYLLDNYFILTRETRFSNGSLKKVVVSRPLPLSFIRLASFSAAPETRREKIEDGGILDTFRSQNITLYPFTLYHASPTLMKGYTLYTTSEAQRKKWHACFVDALGVHQARQEGNEWFLQEQLVDGFFRVPRESVNSPGARPTGKVTAAVPFATRDNQRYLAIGCATGIYVSPLKNPKELVKVFTYASPTYLAALQSVGDKVFNKFIIHADNKVVSYSLELIARFANSRVDPKVLEASKENVTSSDQNVLFIKHVILEERVLLIYAAKKRMSSSVSIHAIEAIAISTQRSTASAPSSFRQFGQPGYLPKDASDILALSKTISICVRGGLVIAQPGDLPNTASNPMPGFQESNPSAGMTLLKSKIDNAKPLGLVKCGGDEFLVIFEDIGCFMDRKGHPLRNYGFVKWETKATSYAHRNGLVLLISPRFIEIRAAFTGRLVQVIEGGDIRLLYAEPAVTSHDNVIVAMRGKYNDNNGLSEKIVELAKTVELGNVNASASASVWSEWDM